MTRTLQTTYRYRLQPTATQRVLLRQFAGARRWIWNWALARRIAHYKASGQSLSLTTLCAELVKLKQQPETDWLNQIDSQSLQQALRDLDQAYAHFFRRVKQRAKKPGFPKFKSRHRDTPRFRIPQRVTLAGTFVQVPKIGQVRAIVHRPLEGTTKSAGFVQEPDGAWYVTFVVEQHVPAAQPRPIRAHVGIDVGLKSLISLSNGETIANPRWYRTQMRKLRRAQQVFSRRQKGSTSRAKARQQVARLHAKVRRQRQDFLHKLSARLVRDYDLITIEDLNVRGLARTKLATSVLDAGWGMLRSFLTYKAERNGTHLLMIGRFFPSSKTCGACGRVNDDLTLADRQWVCPCGAVHDRDLNAARNIDHEGLRLYHLTVAAGLAETQNAGGDWVSPLELGGTDRRNRKPKPLRLG
jgi:putative transposase